MSVPTVVQLFSELPSIVGLVAVLVPILASPDRPSRGGFDDDSGLWSAREMIARLERGDLVALEEMGINMSPDDAIAAFMAPERDLSLAGLVAARGAEEGWVLLEALAERAGSPDRPIAVAAAETAFALASELEAGLLAEREVTDDELEGAASAWRALAANRAGWPDIRVRALEVSARLARLRGLHGDPDHGSGFDLETLARDAEPEVRRAAFELAPHALSADGRAVCARSVREDVDMHVALAAAQALCASVTQAQIQDGESPALDALGDEGLARVRALVGMDDGSGDGSGDGSDDGSGDGSPVARLDAARCLAVDGSEESLMALQGLAKDGPRVIRASVDALRASSAKKVGNGRAP